MERLDLLLLALETIDLNGNQSIFNMAEKLNLKEILPSKVYIWKLRCCNPMRKTSTINKINTNEFDALIKVTVEMSKFLYPYIRAILASKDNYIQRPKLWDEFQTRYIDMISKRFNNESIRVKNLTDISRSNSFFNILLFNLALCISDNGYQRLKNILIRL